MQALQIFDVLRVVGSSHVVSAGLVIGGKDVRSEQELINTMNVLVATPGRLLQHMDETPGFDCSSLLVLVLDEADRILDLGFEKTLNSIIENLPKERQTLLFSATLTKSVKALARLSLSRDAEVIGVHGASAAKRRRTASDADTDDGSADGFDMPRKLLHSYLVCELDKKLNVLYSFAKTHIKSKIIVFLSSCKQTKFFYEAIRRARPGLSVMCMHGRMKQMKRMAAYCRFCESTSGSMLLATDIAARGLDFPSVDWVVQLDCPEDVPTYIHRSGRTARYRSSGKSLLFLLPSEKDAMLKKLKAESKIVPRQVSVNANKSFDLQESLAGWVAADPELKYLAQKAFVTFVRSYFLQRDKKVFDVGALPLESYASALGLPGAPRIRFVKKSRKAASAAHGTDSDDDEPAEKRPAKDNVAKLMARKNVGVLDPMRAAMRAEAESSDSDEDDLMQIKRRDHDLPDAGGAAADAEASKKAELKKMSRKQRRLAKQLARGEAPKSSLAHTMAAPDESIDGWRQEATSHASSVRARVAEQDSDDKERERARVRAKHRAERATRRAFEAEQNGDAAPGGAQVLLGSASEDSDGDFPEGGGESSASDSGRESDGGSDGESDGDSLRPAKRAKHQKPEQDLQALASQLLQSRSLF